MSESAVTKEQVVDVIKTIYDPDLYIDIWTLGLIYNISLDGRTLLIKMTFTSPACPSAPQLVEQVRERTKDIDGIDETKVEVVFDPPWEPSDELKGLMGLL